MGGAQHDLVGKILTNLRKTCFFIAFSLNVCQNQLKSNPESAPVISGWSRAPGFSWMPFLFFSLLLSTPYLATPSSQNSRPVSYFLQESAHRTLNPN